MEGQQWERNETNCVLEASSQILHDTSVGGDDILRLYIYFFFLFRLIVIICSWWVLGLSHSFQKIYVLSSMDWAFVSVICTFLSIEKKKNRNNSDDNKK